MKQLLFISFFCLFPQKKSPKLKEQECSCYLFKETEKKLIVALGDSLYSLNKDSIYISYIVDGKNIEILKSKNASINENELKNVLSNIDFKCIREIHRYDRIGIIFNQKAKVNSCE